MEYIYTSNSSGNAGRCRPQVPVTGWTGKHRDLDRSAQYAQNASPRDTGDESAFTLLKSREIRCEILAGWAESAPAAAWAGLGWAGGVAELWAARLQMRLLSNSGTWTFSREAHQPCSRPLELSTWNRGAMDHNILYEQAPLR